MCKIKFIWSNIYIINKYVVFILIIIYNIKLLLIYFLVNVIYISIRILFKIEMKLKNTLLILLVFGIQELYTL